MYPSMTVNELAENLAARIDRKRDLVVSTNAIDLGVFSPEGEAPFIAASVDGKGIFAPNKTAHSQIAQWTKIDKRYYDRMLTEAPELLVTNVRHWFDATPKPRMLRCMMDETRPVMRAFLSDSYNRLDNDQLATVVLQNMPEDAVPLSMHCDDDRLHMKLLNEGIEIDLGSTADGSARDIVRPGISISNDEVGKGGQEACGFWFRDYCKNGLVFGAKHDWGVRHRHVGQKALANVENEVLTTETQQARNAAMMLEVRDMVASVGKEEVLQTIIDRLMAAKDSRQIVQADAPTVIEELSQDFMLTADEQKGALMNLVQDRDFSLWGMTNAVTKLANDAPTYERAHELEELGGKLLDMDLKRWNQFAKVTMQ